MHCLGVKIVDIAMFKFNCALFTTKVPYQFARAHVFDASHHIASFTIELHSLNFIGVPNFASPGQSFPKVKVPVHMHSARAAHVHSAPHHKMACTIELHSLNSICVPTLVSAAQNFLEPKDPSRIKFCGPSARSLHLT